MGGWKTNQSPIPQPLVGEFLIISMWDNQRIGQRFQLVADEHQKFMSAPRYVMKWWLFRWITTSYPQWFFFKEHIKIPPASMDVSTSLKNLKVVISASLRIWDSLKFTIILSWNSSAVIVKKFALAKTGFQIWVFLLIWLRMPQSSSPLSIWTSWGRYWHNWSLIQIDL